MSHLRRRLLTIPAFLLALPILLLAGPIIVILGACVDLIQGLRRLPTVRLWAFAVVFVVLEWAGQIYALWLWIAGGLGRSLRYSPHQRMQAWWVASLLWWAEKLLRVSIDLDDLSTMPEGDLIVFSRHASMVDALLPAYLFTTKLKRPVHYVIKKELMTIPNIDVYGHRLGNHFLDRGGNRDHELNQMVQLTQNAEPEAALVIFPEGTYATPDTKRRVQASLERGHDPQATALNKHLRHLLPPKRGGPLTLLSERPEAPVVFIGHVGLEELAELDGLRRGLPANRPVKVRWWVQPRESIPVTSSEQVAWLDQEWIKLDQWVTENLA